jgi:hypothetical protein
VSKPVQRAVVEAARRLGVDPDRAVKVRDRGEFQKRERSDYARAHV